jgi:hypothetical protein
MASWMRRKFSNLGHEARGGSDSNFVRIDFNAEMQVMAGLGGSCAYYTNWVRPSAMSLDCGTPREPFYVIKPNDDGVHYCDHCCL